MTSLTNAPPSLGMLSMKSKSRKQQVVDQANLAIVSHGMSSRNASIVGMNRAMEKTLMSVTETMLETRLKPALEASDADAVRRVLNYDHQLIVALDKQNNVLGDELDEIKIKYGMSEEEVTRSREERERNPPDIYLFEDDDFLDIMGRLDRNVALSITGTPANKKKKNKKTKDHATKITTAV